MRRSDPQQPPTETLPAVVKPAESDIAARAYDRYLARGRADGQDLEDWLAAERELTAERREQLQPV
jgi:hypothetical protein